ncbi:helitron helicase-like domain-containing protein [Flagellimonas marinaquae]
MQHNSVCGHLLISNKSNGVREIGTFVLKRNCKLQEHVALVFSGSRQQLSELKRQVRTASDPNYFNGVFHVRTHVVLSWLKFFYATNHPVVQYTTQPNLEELTDKLTNILESWSNSVIWEENDPMDENEANRNNEQASLRPETFETSFAHSQPQHSSTAVGQAAEFLRVTRSTSLANDFFEQDQNLLLTFPTLFPIELECLSNKPMPLTRTRQLLLYHDRRFSIAPYFLHYLFNLQQRWDAAKSGRATIKYKDCRRFVRTVNQASFLETIHRAINGNFTEQRRLLKELGHIIKVASKNVLYSAGQKSDIAYQIISLTYMFGLPSFFVTVSPCDFNDIIALKMALCRVDYENESEEPIQILMGNQYARFETIAKDPAAASYGYITQINLILDHLVRLTRSKNVKTHNFAKTRGIFGTARAHVGVTEEQSRGSLHWHGMIWSDLSPELVDEYAHKLSWREAIVRCLDKCILCQLPTWVQDQSVVDQTLQSLTNRYGKDVLTSLCKQVPPYGTKDYYDRLALLMAKYCKHKHCATCVKGKRGAFQCREAKPQRPSVKPCLEQLKFIELGVDGVTVKKVVSVPIEDGENKVLQFIPCRPNELSQWLSETNDVLLSCTSCNSNVVFLGGATAANVVRYYMQKYCGKNDLEPKKTVLLMQIANRHAARANHSSNVDQAVHFLTAHLNATSRVTEISSTTAALALLNEPLVTCSHTFYRLNNVLAKVKAYKNYCSATNASVEALFSEDDSDAESLEEDETHNDDVFQIHLEDAYIGVNSIDVKDIM